MGDNLLRNFLKCPLSKAVSAAYALSVLSLSWSATESTLPPKLLYHSHHSLLGKKAGEKTSTRRRGSRLKARGLLAQNLHIIAKEKVSDFSLTSQKL